MTIPENVPLDGMKPKVTISENATITPLPETITDWSQDLIFRVKSYSGAEREYRYSLIRTETPEYGTVHLHTQAEVDAFAESGIKTVEGSLFIGTNHEVAPSDSIVSLEALASLEKVGGNVAVYPTYKASEFNIRNLKSIGGNFNVTLNNVHTLRMPSLETVYGTLAYSSEGTEMLTVHVAHTVDLPSLKVIGDNLEINIANYYNTITEDSHISVPELEKIGGKLTAGINIVSSYVKFPKLKEVGSIEWKGSLGAETDKAIYGISFDALERVNGDFIMKDVAGLCELAAPDLVSVGGKLDISIQNGMHLKVTDFRSLVSINGDLESVLYEAICNE